ncbi:MAG: hypothetical protein O3A92_15845, partial [Verrucomicrobia bacterium]|nr:hypothetical protein [Verrucomicrobiota bacterium]
MRKRLVQIVVGLAVVGVVLLALEGMKLLRGAGAVQSASESWMETVLWTKGNKGDVLEVATRGTMERIERRTTYAWWGLYAGTSTVRIRVPVVFRYHILLSDPWELEVSGDLCTVRSPEVRPSNPPAILTEGFERYADNAWSRWDAPQKLAELERDLTGELSRRAGSEEVIETVKDKARQSVAGFVRRWILTKEFEGRDGLKRIKVVFPGEKDSALVFDVEESGAGG